jgi:hypothetical protein
MHAEPDQPLPGWQPLIAAAQYHATLNGLKLVQIKEKWGGLRIYAQPDPDATPAASPDLLKPRDFERLLESIEHVSLYICMVCGKPGTCKATPRWITTLCDEHREQRLKERAEDLA